MCPPLNSTADRASITRILVYEYFSGRRSTAASVDAEILYGNSVEHLTSGSFSTGSRVMCALHIQGAYCSLAWQPSEIFTQIFL